MSNNDLNSNETQPMQCAGRQMRGTQLRECGTKQQNRLLIEQIDG